MRTERVWAVLGDEAAGVGLLGLLVEHLGGLAEVVGPLHQVVQLNATLQHRVDRLVLQRPTSSSSSSSSQSSAGLPACRAQCF